MKKFKKKSISVLSCLVAVCFIFSFFALSFKPVEKQGSALETDPIKKADATLIDLKTEQFFDDEVVYKLPSEIASNQEISVIVSMNTETILDVYSVGKKDKTVSEFVLTKEAKKVSASIEKQANALISKLDRAGVKYTLGERYDTIISGFEITINSNDFEKINGLLSSKAELILGDVYEPCHTEVVTNDVDVYETGIFDSSASEYQGDGVVVAVLDSGLDYTHTAFSVDNFETADEDLALTLAGVSAKVGKTVASSYTYGLTGEDVYLNKKVPYAYDYADKDTDVLPINSEHGTHVAGVIAGKDDVITGVAPNAQLAIMKVFSDAQEGARSSWIMAALEDCVNLGVDVINMSLGSSCGFTREVDKVKVNEVYDKIKAAGISLIVAASNDYNSTFSSEKNGSNPLTRHPDSGTVGSPATYEAALAVASVDGVKTPYILYNDQIIYFTEASTADAEQKDFVDDVLNAIGDNVNSHTFEYVTIPGVGRSSDYPESGDFYAGKIVLVKRGTTTFEDKVRVALKEKGAAGIIIYNNVSGTISMAVGQNIGAVCSISQDQGEMMAAAGTGKIKISRDQLAGPFMSDFSSWGPTSDLKIKPEITAHGGEILSSVPGQGYDRQSGTSMACPNQAGAAALIRQYVKYSGTFGAEEDLDAVTVTSLVNRLMMSTADIVKNKNGLPYAVRKQGSGLVNINKAATSAGYLTTLDRDGKEMDKVKFELGDDKQSTGVYEMKFIVNNVSASSVTYDIGSIVMTEGVSETYTSHDDTTSTQDGYILTGATTTVTGVSGNGTLAGSSVTVPAGKNATVSVKITLSDEDKAYIKNSFENGMYVEGFITLKATAGTTVDMNAPFLAFLGDWNKAPVFDEEYYDTHKDEINAGLDVQDKTMADAYATRVIGGLYSDYIATLGTYYFDQDPSATQIAADKKYIAISNQEAGTASAVNSIYGVWAGLLRNAKEVNIVITEESTGKVIFEKTEWNVMKSYSSGGGMYASSIDIDFKALENDLKNNTKYNVKITSYIDYGTKEEQDAVNKRNVFEFPLFIDFQAPVVTDVEYRAEYDKTAKKTRLYADMFVYDNHYAMGLQLGQVTPEDYATTGFYFAMESFGKYVTPVYSSFNSTSKVTVELTDYVAQLKNSAGHAGVNPDGTPIIDYNNNSFLAVCYDYALNTSMFEIRIPDEILAIHFKEDTITLNPNETKAISDVLEVYPTNSWLEVLNYEISAEHTAIVDVVNHTIVAKASGDAVITAVGKKSNGDEVRKSVNVHVLAPGEDGYNGRFTIPSVSKFAVTGYKTNKAFYIISSDERDIGVTNGSYDFGNGKALSMYPSESVTLRHVLESYSADKTTITYSSGNEKIVSVTPDGTIVAKEKGSAVISVRVLYEGKATTFVEMISVNVKDPWITSGSYLTAYRGNGGNVVIPTDRGITRISQYAFSGYEYVAKDVSAGDVIDDEDTSTIKPWPIGEDTIKRVVVPEGVTHIDTHAFAFLTALEAVELPSTVGTLGVGSFMGCSKLASINLEYVKFINEDTFNGCALEEVVLNSAVAIGNDAFRGCSLTEVELPETAQSIGGGAFAENVLLESIFFNADKVKIGANAFEYCEALNDVEINAAVIAPYAFLGCSALNNLTLGADVAVIGEYAFYGTNLSKFKLSSSNRNLTVVDNGMLFKGNELIVAAPKYDGDSGVVTTNATAIASGAFVGNKLITAINASSVKTIGAYAFAECANLATLNFSNLEVIGDYAFMACTGLTATPDLSKVTRIGEAAFAGFVDENGYHTNQITSVNIPDGVTVGDYAFYVNSYLESVTLGDGVTVGEGAFMNPLQLLSFENLYSADPDWTIENLNAIFTQFYTPYNYTATDGGSNSITLEYLKYNLAGDNVSSLTNLVIGDNVVLGQRAFDGNAILSSVTFGNGVTVGNYAFYNNDALTTINNFSGIKEIGAYAFSGDRFQDFAIVDGSLQYAFEYIYIGGEWTPIDYVYTDLSPKFTDVDLTNVVSLGEGAFANNVALRNVIFKAGDQAPSADGKAFTAIPAYAFANCSVLQTITLPSYINAIGDFAFIYTKIEEIDLTNVSTLGSYAFAGTTLMTATLKEGAIISDGAFAYCEILMTVNNLDKAVYIGDSAFMGTYLSSVDLTSAKHIGDFAFANSMITEVVLGENLESLGSNPFLACEIVAYGKNEELKFHEETVGTFFVTDCDISDTVKVIDGVLYQVVPNGGLELVSYPMKKENAKFTVADGTVKIGEQAFAGATLNSVTLPRTLKAIGDKAFYGCANLGTVIFKGYDAPMLEEAFDASYATEANLPYGGNYYGYYGLGIIKYYPWDVNVSTFFYGANFVDYIGHINQPLVMVKPSNGVGYNTFIFDQYFGDVVDGKPAAIQATLDVIDLINALPKNITLADEAKVIAAREAYDRLPSIEQQSLVTNYETLTKAESLIEYLKLRDAETEDGTTTDKTEKGEFPVWAIVLISVFGTAGLMVGGYFTVTFILKKRANMTEEEKAEKLAKKEAKKLAKEQKKAEKAKKDNEDTSDKEEK